jgi:hypothetical protein
MAIEFYGNYSFYGKILCRLKSLQEIIIKNYDFTTLNFTADLKLFPWKNLSFLIL